MSAVAELQGEAMRSRAQLNDGLALTRIEVEVLGRHGDEHAFRDGRRIDEEMVVTAHFGARALTCRFEVHAFESEDHSDWRAEHGALLGLDEKYSELLR